MPNIAPDHWIFVPYGKIKAVSVMDKLNLTNLEGLILLDDYSENLLEWEKYGGIAVKWLNGINGKTGRRYNGGRVGSVKGLNRTISTWTGVLNRRTLMQPT